MTDGLNTKLKVYYSSKGLNNKKITGHLNSKQVKVCYPPASQVLKSGTFFCKNDPYLNKIQNNFDQNFFRIDPFWAVSQQHIFTNGPFKNLSKLAPFAGGP